jgi:rhodanese-related sulfurtransferase
MKVIIIVFLLAITNLLKGQEPDSVKFRLLRPDEFQKEYNRKDSSILIDVREFFEFRKSRIKNAVNIPSSGNLESVADTLDKRYSLFLYCTSGFRSKRVARFFCNKGFSKVISLDGGIQEWKKEGMAVEKKRIRRRE